MATTVFTSANLLDGEHPAKPDTTVVVEGNVIRTVTTGRVDVAADRVIDLAGKTLMPGMTSGHFHTTYHNVGGSQLPFGLEVPPAYAAYQGLANAQLALRCGFTSVVGASCAFDVDASLAQAIRNGLVVGPRVRAASRDLITTSDSNDTLPWWWEARGMGVVRVCDGPDEFRKAVRDEIKRGAEVIKVYVTGGHGVTTAKHNVSLALDELHAVVDAAHGRGVRVRAHVAHKQAILDCVRAGVDIIDHADGMDDECIEAFVDAGTFVLPSLYLPIVMMKFMGAAGDVARVQRANERDEPASEAGDVARVQRANERDEPASETGDAARVQRANERDEPASETGETKMGFDSETGQDFLQMCAILGRAAEAGVKLCIGDDFGAAPTPHGDYVNEMEVYVEHAHVPPLEVLRWATKNGAALYGEPDRLGTVEEGKLADLVVIDGDPSVDIGALRNIDLVMVDGRVL